MMLFVSIMTSVQFFLQATSTYPTPVGDLSSPTHAHAAFNFFVLTSLPRYLLLGTLSSIIGQYILAIILLRYRKQSLIVFCITLMLIVSELGLGIRSIMTFVQDVQVLLGTFYCDVAARARS